MYYKYARNIRQALPVKSFDTFPTAVFPLTVFRFIQGESLFPGLRLEGTGRIPEV